MAIAQLDYHDHIVCDPQILVGKPTVKGTRISVELVLDELAYDLNPLALIESYPGLTLEDIKACLEYASRVLAGDEELPEALREFRATHRLP